MEQDDINENLVVYNDFSSISKGHAISISNCSFSWGKIIKAQENNDNKINQKYQKVLKNINISIEKGSLVFIIGEVGSGKSSLLQAILNNLMILEEDQRHSKISVNGSISYVAQNSWIRNDTVKNNILFFNNYDDVKYNKTLELCELYQDLLILQGGDLTEIGEKGINLSGGQKARIAIARAIYSDSDIYLFDDPISALDSHIGEKIIKNCILGHLKNKTRILVTHANQYLPFADRILVMKEGEIFWDGTYDNLKNQDFYKDYVNSIEKNENKNEKESVEEKSRTDGKTLKKEGSTITIVEKQVKGQVGKAVYLNYLNFFGGIFLFCLIILCNLSWQTLSAVSDYWLTVWVKSQNKKNVNFLQIYILLNIFIPFLVILRIYFLTKGAINSSNRIHKAIVENLIRAPINTFHETTPKGQILNKLSKDLNDIDVNLILDISASFISGSRLLGSIVICSIFMYYSLLILPILIFVGFKLTKYYIHSSRDLTRLERINRSPILNVFSETISGAITIRAFKYENKFQDIFLSKLDELYKSTIFIAGVRQWFSLYIDFINLIYFIILILFTFIFSSVIDYRGIGLILTRTLGLQTTIMEFLDSVTKIENDMISAERCFSLIELPAEAPLELINDKELQNWPTIGKIIFENFSVKYRQDTPIVIKNMNIRINQGEKIGIVGRTGCGKSTLCLCLLRILEAERGRILIDDCDISQIGLKLLRNKVTIIPQDAVLFEGSLRFNLDPLNQYNDQEIRNVLNQIGLNLFAHTNEDNLNLHIQENGSNLSAGEKQLVSIGRAILRGNKIVIMDEATSNIDFKTEELIQQSIIKYFQSSTLITIAHRIKTIINYDKILVMSNGEIIEFDSPQNLLANENSEFYHLYSKSTIKINY